MRLVLDTNVLIAAFLSRGRCAEVVRHCFDRHVCVTSRELLDEFGGKLLGKFRMDASVVEELLDGYYNRFTIVKPVSLALPVSRDSDDDMVLATAVTGMCTLIITGDKDLLSLGSYDGIRIVSPGELLTVEHP